MKQIVIFYADDDEDDLMFFTEAVEKISSNSENKIHLHLHLNGEHLIENIKKNKDSNGVIFLDINMPVKSGFDILVQIRNEPEIKEFPVVMYSTSSNPDNIEKSQKLGANHYVVKPYEFNNLIKLLSNLFNMNPEGFQADNKTFLIK